MESANALYLDKRELPILDMLDGIWHREKDRRAMRMQKAIKHGEEQPLTPWGYERSQETDFFGQGNDVLLQCPMRRIGTMIQCHNHQFQVDLQACSCSCRRFLDTDIPCGHALSIMYACNRSPAEYFPQYIKAATGSAPTRIKTFHRLT